MHWLAPLLNPRSIAVVGASPKAESLGGKTLRLLQSTGYRGEVYAVNPRYQEVQEWRCYPDLSRLPAAPDLVVFAVAGAVLERTFEEAIERGARSAVIYASSKLADDVQPPLLDRLRARAQSAGLPVCGGNGMGFQNYDAGTMVSFDRPRARLPGHVTLIAHSGSVMTYLANNDRRFTYNLVVSSGQEINGTFVDYMDYALAQPSTRVIALFLEAVRDPEGFVVALEHARSRGIPVVVAKVGRTERSAHFAVSHSGAAAGDDQAFQAVCERYGALRVRHMDELANTAYLLSLVGRPPAGGVASITDSGGLREQFIDLAADAGVPFARLSAETRGRIARVLEHGLEADNPLDAMGALNADVGSVYSECIDAMLADADTAVLSVEFEFRDDLCHYPVLLDVVKAARRRTDKPVVVVNSFAASTNADRAAELSGVGVPVINGAGNALSAISNMLWLRDSRNARWQRPPQCEESTARHWRRTLARSTWFDEAAALDMLADFGVPAVPHRRAGSLAAALEAGEELGYPLATKSARPGLLHKTEAGGVRLFINDRAQAKQAYLELSTHLGAEVMLAPMVSGEAELAFGMINDAQFGPVVMVSAGGVAVELFEQRGFALAPFGEDRARRLLEDLKITALLKGARGREPCDLDRVAAALACFSAMVHALRGSLREMDVNPVIVHRDGCVAVDALAVPFDLADGIRDGYVNGVPAPTPTTPKVDPKCPTSTEPKTPTRIPC